MEHDLFEIPFDGCKEDVVQRADAHREFGVPEETASLWELYCVLDGFGNVKGCASGY
jgi:hypothetical protein